MGAFLWMVLARQCCVPCMVLARHKGTPRSWYCVGQTLLRSPEQSWPDIGVLTRYCGAPWLVWSWTDLWRTQLLSWSDIVQLHKYGMDRHTGTPRYARHSNAPKNSLVQLMSKTMWRSEVPWLDSSGIELPDAWFNNAGALSSRKDSYKCFCWLRGTALVSFTAACYDYVAWSIWLRGSALLKRATGLAHFVTLLHIFETFFENTSILWSIQYNHQILTPILWYWLFK